MITIIFCNLGDYFNEYIWNWFTRNGSNFGTGTFNFRPKKLPEIGSSLGKALKGFQQASKEFEDEFKKEAQKLEETAKIQPEKNSTVASTPTENSVNTLD